MYESPELAESWVLEVEQQNERLGGLRQGGSISRFLWASQEHQWEVGSTPDGPLNPGRAFLLSFLG